MPGYAVTLSRRYDGLFVATFPDVPDAVAYGRDHDEVIEEAAKSLEAAIRRRILNGDEVPSPRTSGPICIQQEVLAAVLA
jgi:predicted RNase H-like HicB family nuclease